MVTDNPDLQEAFPKPPVAGLRQGPNLRRQLCKKSHQRMEEVQYHHRQTLSVLICTILFLICTLFPDYFPA